MISTSSKPFVEIGLMHVKIVMVFKLLTYNAYKHIQASVKRHSLGDSIRSEVQQYDTLRGTWLLEKTYPFWAAQPVTG